MSSSLEALVDAVEAIYRYRQQKTFYECRQAILKAKQDLAAVQYAADAALQREHTVELHRCRLKLARLREFVDATEPEYGVLFDDLLNCLEKRISTLENLRKPQRPV